MQTLMQWLASLFGVGSSSNPRPRDARAVEADIARESKGFDPAFIWSDDDAYFAEQQRKLDRLAELQDELAAISRAAQRLDQPGAAA